MYRQEFSEHQKRLENLTKMQIWKRMANSGVPITVDYGKSIVKEILEFSGCSRIFDVLSLPGQFFTAVSRVDYTSKSYLKLIDTIEKFNEPLARVIDEHGISHRILSKGDRTLATGWENPSLIYVDIEECFESVPDLLRTLYTNDNDDVNITLRAAIAEYELSFAEYRLSLIGELLVSLKTKFNTTPEEIYKLLG